MTAAIVVGPLAALEELADADTLAPEVGLALVFVLGVGVLGLIDDLLGGRRPAGAGTDPAAPRGLRGHLRAVSHGEFSTGMLKAAGTLGLALYVLAGEGRSTADYLVGVGLLVLATHLFNLLDLRPGRSVKALVLLGAGLTAATQITEPAAALGLFLGPVLVCAFYDLREQAMLGDAGSNVIGAIAGVWIVLTLDPSEQLVALLVLLLINIYGEFRSISTVIEKVPGLRHLDSLGRPS
jgi:hypothetical protein